MECFEDAVEAYNIEKKLNELDVSIFPKTTNSYMRKHIRDLKNKFALIVNTGEKPVINENIRPLSDLVSTMNIKVIKMDKPEFLKGNL